MKPKDRALVIKKAAQSSVNILPDLIVSEIILDSDSIHACEPLAFTYTIENIGSEGPDGVSTFDVAGYLSTNSVRDPSEVPPDWMILGPDGSSGTYAIWTGHLSEGWSQSLYVDDGDITGLAPGTYYLIFEVDTTPGEPPNYLPGVAEMHEDNNSLAIQFTVLPCADIAITGGAFTPAQPCSVDTLDVRLQVSNLGNIPITNALVSVFIGIGGTAYAFADQDLPKVSLSPGETADLQVLWPLLPVPEFGNKDVRVFALADASRILDEVDEDNNTFDLGQIRVEPTEPFVCPGSGLIFSEFEKDSYECFDIRESTVSDVADLLLGVHGDPALALRYLCGHGLSDRRARHLLRGR